MILTLNAKKKKKNGGQECYYTTIYEIQVLFGNKGLFQEFTKYHNHVPYGGRPHQSV